LQYYIQVALDGCPQPTADDLTIFTKYYFSINFRTDPTAMSPLHYF